jgi:hypothetical protein
MGRFLSPDWSAKVEPVPYAKLDDPQTLNLYVYVRNNPLIRIDADGHEESFGRQIADIVEVSYSEGAGAHAEIQAGHNEVHANVGANVEASIGLGGGNAEVKVFGGADAGGKAGPVEGKVEAGATLSSAEGASLNAKAQIGAGSLHAGGGVSLDKEGLHKSVDVGADKSKDSKLGVHVQAEVGVGVAINFSQAERVAGKAWGAFKSAMSTNFMPKVSIPGSQKPKPEDK